MARFVAEISSNHNGDRKRCLDLIRAAAACGCWGVKFQLFRVEQLFAPEILQRSATHRDRRRWELPVHFLPELADCAREEGLAFGCTPFHLDAVDLLRPHVDFLKIASYELPWLELTDRCARTGLPLMMSCGMADEAEITAAVNSARQGGCTDLSVLHCVSNYPAAPRSCNLAALGSLRRLLDREFPGAVVGWSDHSVDPGVVRCAIDRWGADVVEFHFDLEGMGEEFDGGHCWLPERIAPLIAGAGYPAPAGCDGSYRLAAAPSEADERLWRADPSDGLRPNLSVRRVWSRDRSRGPAGPLVPMLAGGPGLGHVARLLALAEVLRDRLDARILLFTPETPGAGSLPARHGFAWQSALPAVADLVALEPAACVVDRKEPCDELVDGLRQAGVPVVVLDRPDCLGADLGIVPAFHWTPQADRPELHGGPQYLQIRSDVTRLRPDRAPEPGSGVVVSFGGEDPFCLTERVARALAHLPGDMEVRFLIGQGFARHRQSWPPVELQRPNFRLLGSEDPTETLLPGAGLLITAMGVTIAEAMVLGVPVAVLANYASDAPEVRFLAGAGAVADLGYQAETTDADLSRGVARIWADARFRAGLAEVGWRLCDGLGARRAGGLVAGLLDGRLPAKEGPC